MDTLWIGVDPQPEVTRLLVLSGPQTVLLKARLRPSPSSRLALGALAEALCLWEGRRGRVALVAASPAASCARVPFDEEPFGLSHGALVDVDVVDRLRPPRRARGDGLGGLGSFEDLRQLMLFEAMR